MIKKIEFYQIIKQENCNNLFSLVIWVKYLDLRIRMERYEKNLEIYEIAELLS